MEIEAINHNDYYAQTINLLKKRGKKVITRGKNMIECTGVACEVFNTRDRILTEKNRKWSLKIWMHEFLWYQSENPNVKTISKYLKAWSNFADENGMVNSNYGFHWGGQVKNIIRILKNDSGARHASFNIYESKYSHITTKDVPCTFAVQFLVRNDKLDIIVFNRSRDLCKGEHGGDFFNFSLLQELIANELDLDVGSYKAYHGSLHLYESDWDKLENPLDFGLVNSLAVKKTKLKFSSFWEDLKQVILNKNTEDFISSTCLEKQIDYVEYYDDYTNRAMSGFSEQNRFSQFDHLVQNLKATS